MKGKKKIISVLIAVVLVMTMSTSVLAQEPPHDTDTSNATVTFTSGVLELVTVPGFDFGTHTIPASGSPEYQAITISSPLTVSDARGTGAGWQVTVALAGFTDAGDDPSLNGAYITLTNGVVTPVDSTSPDTFPVVSSPVMLNSTGVETPLVTAVANTGKGAWEINWAASTTDATLTVPAVSHSPGTHTAELTWNLIDAP